MKRFILFSLLFFSFSAFSQSSDIADIAGWRKDMGNGVYHFTSENGNGNTDYYIMPLEKNIHVNDLYTWLKTKAQSDIISNGWTENKARNTSRQSNSEYNGVYNYLTAVSNKAGKSEIAMYVAYALPDNSIRWAKVYYPSVGFNKNDIATSLQHLAALSKQEMTANNTAGNNSTTQENEAKKSSSDMQAITSNNRNTSSDIMGVILHKESAVGVGGIALQLMRPYLFFKDGSFYGWLDTDPNSIHIASHSANPKKWGTWKMNGKNISIVWYDGKSDTWTSAWWQHAVPASKSDRLAGSFESISGGGNTVMGGGSYTMSSKYITFSKDGHFTFESVGSGGYSGYNGSNSAWSSRNAAGTYELDGFSIIFKYNSGKTVRSAFYFYDDDKDMFGINTSIYTKEDD
ncbi:hypothetical protein A9P82_04675 [Arachidicoccus ginsenosidimutans]|uniref:hypothetical protein n=1 Tax=Arachidicoccus sp. BS20 TaxID=1850526 RepID=UPI0007F080D5|nr:hypothetical protein [Arachidicoccus sp. BS20]ANI88642.1 hypothetical protein A9P82_04675 [Arachidicoccus sp. BS20]